MKFSEEKPVGLDFLPNNLLDIMYSMVLDSYKARIWILQTVILTSQNDVPVIRH